MIEKILAVIDKHIDAAKRTKDAPIYKNGVPMAILIQDMQEMRAEIDGISTIRGGELDAVREKLRLSMLAQPTSGKRKTFADGIAQGLAIAIDKINSIPLASKGWQPVETAPYACHVLATYFDNDCGEWVVAVVMSPPSSPFTRWRHLPENPGSASLAKEAT